MMQVPYLVIVVNESVIAVDVVERRKALHAATNDHGVEAQVIAFV